jgi:hypothetical protein
MKLFDVLRGSKTGEKIVAEVLATTFEARSKLVADRERIRADSDRALGPLVVARNATRERLELAETELREARSAAWRADVALVSHGKAVELGVARIDAELRRGADPRIEQFVEALQAELQAFRNAIGGGDAKQHAHLDGLGAAIVASRELSTQAQTDGELSQALEAIRSRIPSKYSAAA